LGKLSGIENQSWFVEFQFLRPGEFAGDAGGFGFVTGWLMRRAFSSA
jgi:hypothetical protein